MSERRRSRELTLLAVPVLAAAFSACGGNDSAYCVDRTNRVVENRFCDNYQTNPGYYWYYGGHAGNGGYRTGALISGGDRVSTANVSENIKRGGFGSSSSSREGGVGRSTGGHSSGGG